MELVRDEDRETYSVLPLGIHVRSEIVDIAILMEIEMRKHAGTKGDSWKTMHLDDLELIMQTELKELQLSLDTNKHIGFNYNREVRSKIVDAMNMLWMYHKRLETEE